MLNWLCKIGFALLSVLKGDRNMDYSLTKIAKELGLSKATVSLVLSGKARQARISEDAEERVKKFCAEVNYVPNIHAQRVNRKFAENIGFLINRGVRVDVSNPFADSNINGIMGGIVIAAENAGCRVSVQLYTDDMDESRVFDWLRNHEIDGLIYYGLNIPKEWKKTFSNEGRHVVGISTEPDRNISSINTNNFDASAKLTKYLIDKGRRRFMYLSGIDNTFVADERKRGFLSALKENDIEFCNDNMITAEFSESIAEKKILEKLPDVDAIVCANDDMAIGAMKALKKMNISIPEQIAVAGADNINVSGYVSPSLTTFDNKQHELGVAAVETVIKMIKGEKAKNIIIESDIVIREST